MTLTTYPFDLQIDRLFNEALRPFSDVGTQRVPQCNVWEDADHFYIEAALPGWQQKDIELKVADGVATLTGEWSEKAPEDRVYHLHEVAWGRFTRSFELPTNVDAAKATASFKNGMLVVDFPKREDTKPRQIAIQ